MINVLLYVPIHQSKFYNLLPIFVLTASNGDSLGYWMSECMKHDEPIKLPISITSDDGLIKAMLKVLIRDMICPYPATRISITDVSRLLQSK